MKLNKSFSHLSYAAVPMLFATAAVAQMPMRWTPASAGIPGDATPVGNNSGLYICQAPYNGGRHPGSIQADGCHIGWGGNEVVLRDYTVLSGNGMWVPSSQDANAAFPAGLENNVPLLLCRAAFNNVSFPGKVVNGSCNIAAGGAERVVDSDFQLFYPGVRSLSGDQPVRVTFHNPLSANVTYYWIGYNGAPKKYGNIPAGGDVTVETFASHPWLFDVGIQRLCVYTAGADMNQYMAVGPQPAVAPPPAFVGAPSVVAPVAAATAAALIIHEEREAARSRERAVARELELAHERQLFAEQRAEREAAERRQREVAMRLEREAEKNRIEIQRQAMRAQEQAAEQRQREATRQAILAQQQAMRAQQQAAEQQQRQAARQAMLAQQQAMRAQQQAAEQQQRQAAQQAMLAQQRQQGQHKPGCQPSQPNCH